MLKHVSKTLKRVSTQWPLYLLLVPTVGLVLLFCYYPSFAAIKYSFYRWDGAFVKEFRGLDNFRKALFHDPLFWKTFQLVAVLFSLNLLKMWPSIFTAVVIHRLKSQRWQYLYRVLFVIPMIIPGLVTLLIWKSFFDPTTGILNEILNATHIMDILIWIDTHFLHWQSFVSGQPAWLSHTKLIIPALAIWGFPWVGVVGVLIYLAGLQNISQDIYDAAKIDGVGWWGKFTRIELPLILTQVRLNLILMTIKLLADYSFLLVLLGPHGGPANKGMVPGLYMFREGFIGQRYGYACALGMIVFVIIMSITLFYQRVVKIEK